MTPDQIEQLIIAILNEQKSVDEIVEKAKF